MKIVDRVLTLLSKFWWVLAILLAAIVLYSAAKMIFQF
jgi:hypothetical protein